MPLKDFKCDLWPVLTEPTLYINGTPPSDAPLVQYSFSYENILVEYAEDNTASLFLTYSENGVTKIFRDEYTQLKFFPMQEATREKAFALTPFFNFEKPSPKVVTMNATCYDPAGGALFAYQWIWEFGIDQANVEFGGIAIKFSIRVYNYNHTSETSPELGVASIYRLQHSPVGGEPLQCSGSPIRTECNSSVLSTVVSLNLDVRQGATVALTTRKTEFKFTYSYIGTLDGRSLLIPGLLYTRASAYYYGIGYDSTLKLAQSNNRTSFLPRVGTNQWINFLVRLQFKPFKDMYYDPDVQLRLLFVVDEPPKAMTSGAVEDSSSQTLGIALGVSFTLVVAIAAVVRSF
jgi:hypothetical protein